MVMDCCGADDVNTLESGIIEAPLRRWIDAGDSRLKATDVFSMAGDPTRIY